MLGAFGLIASLDSDNGWFLGRLQALLDLPGNNDFAVFRRTPLVLFHNDLTTRRRRYYRSEEFGYRDTRPSSRADR